MEFCWPADMKEKRLFLACSLESCLFRSQQNCKNKQFIIYFVNWFLGVINPSLGSSEPQQSAAYTITSQNKRLQKVQNLCSETFSLWDGNSTTTDIQSVRMEISQIAGRWTGLSSSSLLHQKVPIDKSWVFSIVLGVMWGEDFSVHSFSHILWVVSALFYCIPSCILLVVDKETMVTTLFLAFMEETAFK